MNATSQSTVLKRARKRSALAMTRCGVTFGAVALSAVLASCGGSGGTSTQPSVGGSSRSVPSSSSPTQSASPAIQPASLNIAVDDGHGQRKDLTLTCSPVGGTVPDPAAACAYLAKLGTAAFEPVGKGEVCTAQFGGPQKATLSGTYGGKAVAAQYDLTDGCQISRWATVKALTGVDGGTDR